MKKNIVKVISVPIVETRDSIFNQDQQVLINLMGIDIWSVVDKEKINKGTIFLQVFKEYDDYFEVVIPGEILVGSRIVKTNKVGNSQWFYRIIK